ncbi:hypothetical protein DICVIV_12146 [Dictyocaulus viviparus]|uniref:Uncharacterized protein n=1 Tax=Dictyocaulus viviparus TaxID=29172 RepID=A0A0D8XHQ3_DICVI|nr:hypothetical protein DICVIV_12146 [Dictyocaulus viviparus]
MRERMDQAFEALCDEMQAPEIPIYPEIVGMSPEAIDEFLLDHGGGVALDMLYNALSLYAAAGLRKPPTRAVEALMAATQDGPPQSDLDRHGDSSDIDDALYGANFDGLILLASAAGVRFNAFFTHFHFGFLTDELFAILFTEACFFVFFFRLSK